MNRRRDFLAFVTAGAVGGCAMLPGVAQSVKRHDVVTLSDPHTDADLIRLCAEHAVNFEAYNAGAGNFEDEEQDPLWQAYMRTFLAIDAAKPLTLAGMLAKAQAAMVEAKATGGEPQVEFTSAATGWAWDLMQDLMRLHATSAGPAPEHPDAALIRLGDDLAAAWATENAAYAAARGENDDDGQNTARAEQLMLESADIVERIEHIQARTPEGMLVKMRAIAWCRDSDPITINDFLTASANPARETCLMAAVLDDLAKLGGQA